MTTEQEGKEMESQIDARRAEEEEKHPLPSESQDNSIDSKFIRQCIWDNEVGDGTLYARIHRDKLVYNNNSDRWLIWNGNYWDTDGMQHALALTGELVNIYRDEIAKITEELADANKEQQSYLDNLLKTARASKRRLLKNTGRAACLKAAVSILEPLAISGFKLDLDPWLLACENGVIDLKNGECNSGKPEQYITMAASVPWPKEGLAAEPELWNKFLDEILDGDKEKIKYLLKALGYALTGTQQIHIFLVLYGEHGRNGKGTIIKLLHYILGLLASPIATEMLLKQKFGRNPSGPSPDIMSMKGKRIVFASEPDENQKFDLGNIKKYTGGDALKARAPHDKMETTFPQSHTVILLTNELPAAKDSDDALWNRLRQISFPFSYVEEPDPKKPYQKKMNDKLEEELREEAPLILAQLVRYCLLWQKEGLIMPDSVRRDSEQWRRDEDPLADFVDDCLEGAPQVVTKSAELYAVFKKWWLKNKNKDPDKTPGVKKFGGWMKSKYKSKKTSGGLAGFQGVQILPLLPVEYQPDPDG